MRNRLEHNVDYWNALLLSLRELTEWVIRKDTELGLAARQDDHRAFRQQLEDKRPLVEASLRLEMLELNLRNLLNKYILL